MNTSEQTTWVRANVAFRNKDYDSAIALYDEAISLEKEPLQAHIRFNRDLALKRLECRPSTQQLLNFKLRPQHQIEIDPDKSERWKSLGNDPHFIVELQEANQINAGWYQIDLTIETIHKKNVAQIYPDYGHGLLEESSITIRYDNSYPTTRIVKFDGNVKLLRFDPKNKVGSFNISNFRIRELSEQQASAAMLSVLNGEYDGEYKIEGIYKEYADKFSAKSGSPNYQQWIDEVEIPSLPSESEIKTTLERIQTQPLISVVMPTFNTDERYLRTCIESVIKQSYPNWELCIADDASPMPHVRQVLEEYRKMDARVKVIYRPVNGHISRASNSALELAKGTYVALLDHDDELPMHALYFVVLAINQTPNVQIIYSDEDKIDERGTRKSPHFKSDWNPDLFYSQNYVSHLGVYKRELLSRISGFRTGVEGSQDYDLLLRCLPHVQGAQIVHIPRVLYHWRAADGSTALATGEKSYTSEAGLKALCDHFAEQGAHCVTVEGGLLPNTYRVCWPIPEPAPLVSLLMPTRDKQDITEVAVRSILNKSTYTNYEILILDNGSIEPVTLAWFEAIQREDHRVKVLRYDNPFNFSAINNFGVTHAKGSIIGLINNDVEVISADWLTEMVSHACREEIGCVGAKLYYTDGRIQHAGVILGLGGVAGHSHKYFERNDTGYFLRLKITQNLSAVTGACLLVRKDIYLAVGGLDETNLKVAFNDVDFCIKIREAGYRNLWSPYAELYHHESLSRGHEDTAEKQLRFRNEVLFMKSKWGTILTFDRYYSPNLTKDHEDFSLSVE